MTEEKRIEVAIQKLAGTYLKDIIQIYACKVEKVNIDDRTCDCIPIGSDSTTKLPGVLLCSENDNGLVVTPSVGSTVIVALSTRNTAFVLMYSSIDKFQFLDGTFGGIVKINELKAQLTILENDIVLLKSLVTSLMAGYAPIDGGAALTAFNAAVIPPIDLANMENNKVIHGTNI